MAVVALWTSLGIYFVSLAVESAVEMRRVTRRKKGKKTMEPYRCCPNPDCARYLFVGRYQYPACQQSNCGWSLVEPSLEDLGGLIFPDEAIDVEATMAYADFIARFGVPVEMDVAVCLMQLEQRYGGILSFTKRTSPLPVVVQRQSTPPPTATPEDLDCAYVDLSQMKADLNRLKYVRYMRDVRGIFCSSSNEMNLP